MPFMDGSGLWFQGPFPVGRGRDLKKKKINRGVERAVKNGEEKTD